MPIARRRTLRVALLALAWGGCAATPLPVDEYVLTATPAAPAAGTSAEGPLIGVGPIAIPGYLRRPEIVTRTASGRIETSPSEVWGEGLAGGFGRVLVADLAALVPSRRVYLAPWSVDEAPTWQVSVQVQRFERDAAGAVQLDAGWQLAPGATGEAAGGGLRSSSIREPIAGEGTAAAVEAMSRAVGRLAGEIAAAIHAAQDAGH